MTHSWGLPPLRPGRAPDETLKGHRIGIEKGIASRKALHPERAHVPQRQTTKGGVQCYELGDPQARAAVVYLHGGGFSLGHPSMWLRYGARIAEEADVRVVMPRYSLAPEHPFPAGLHDVVAVYVAVLQENAGKPVIVMGESAGATLTAALLAAASASLQPYPAAAVIISPVMDFAANGASYDTHAAVDPWVSRAAIGVIADNYLQGYDQADPLASPIHADMSSYPPIQLFCGGREVLLDDTLQFARKLALANRTAEVHSISDAEHGWTFVAPASPAAIATTAHILRFIRTVADEAGAIQPP